MPRLLIVGGAPRVAVDAVRFLCVAASGATAVALAGRLRGALEVDLLLGVDAHPEVPAQRYADRAELESALRCWIVANPRGVVVMSAAVNDYDVHEVTALRSGVASVVDRSAKLPSGADEVVVRLRPAAKVIDQLHGWGLSGPIVGFKFEDKDTVVASAQALRARVGAVAVVANSLCGHRAGAGGSGVHQPLR
jgi:hypothetical protein